MSTMISTEDRITALEARIEALEAAGRKVLHSTRTMSEEDAFRIMTGDLKDVPHKKAAETLGLSYGQVYSCRLEFTFKSVHHELSKQKFKNPWAK